MLILLTFFSLKEDRGLFLDAQKCECTPLLLASCPLTCLWNHVYTSFVGQGPSLRMLPQPLLLHPHSHSLIVMSPQASSLSHCHCHLTCHHAATVAPSLSHCHRYSHFLITMLPPPQSLLHCCIATITPCPNS